MRDGKTRRYGDRAAVPRVRNGESGLVGELVRCDLGPNGKPRLVVRIGRGLRCWLATSCTVVGPWPNRYGVEVWEAQQRG